MTKIKFHEELGTLIGRTIVKATGGYREMCLLLDDGSVVVFEIETGYEAGDIDLVLGDEIGEVTQVELGLISREAYEAKLEEEKRIKERNKQEAERREFERLKQKYGN